MQGPPNKGLNSVSPTCDMARAKRWRLSKTAVAMRKIPSLSQRYYTEGPPHGDARDRDKDSEYEELECTGGPLGEA